VPGDVACFVAVATEQDNVDCTAAAAETVGVAEVAGIAEVAEVEDAQEAAVPRCCNYNHDCNSDCKDSHSDRRWNRNSNLVVLQIPLMIHCTAAAAGDRTVAGTSQH